MKSPQDLQGAKGRAPKEAKDTLRSTQRGEIVDLLGEGIVGGLVNGLKSVYFDGVPVENQDGTRNFEEFALQLSKGGPADETAAHAFGEVQTEVAVGIQVNYGVPVVRTISDNQVDAMRVTITVPALQRTKGNGDVVGAAFDWAIDVQSAGGGFVQVYSGTVSGKASSAYQRAVRVDLKAQGPAPWDVRVRRVSPDSTSASLVDAFQWSSYTAISGVRMLYRHSAVARASFNAEYFSTVPTRAYDMLGISDWEIPSNYDPETGTYSGTWNGTFVLGWTNNPAWVLHNLAKHRRYGLGEYLPLLPDKWELYRLAQWCDGLVPDGKGGTERRYTINTCITVQAEALRLLQDICAVFRGAMLYGAGTLSASWDAPAPMTDIWTPADVVEGAFNYADGSWAAKKSSATCWYNDLSLLGKRMPATWDDPDLIAKYGLRRMEVHPLGITSASMATRLARWALYTTEMEDATVTFRTGAKGKTVRIGAVFGVADPAEAGERLGGRVSAATGSSVTLDAPVTLASGETYKLWVTLQDPTRPDRLIAEQRTVTNAAGTHSVLTVSPAYSAAPIAQTTWLLEGSDVAPTLWRYIGVQEVRGENGAIEYEITGLRYEPGKWELIESNRPLQVRPTRRLPDAAPKVGTISIQEQVYMVDGVPRSRAVVSWPYPAPGLRYLVDWRLDAGPWSSLAPTTANTVQIDDLPGGLLEVLVRSQNALDNVSPPRTASASLAGDVEPPAAAEDLTSEAIPGGARHRWPRPTEDDYAYAQLSQGLVFESAAKIFTGDATEATWTPPEAGSYRMWLQFFDRSGNGSEPTAFDWDYEPVSGATQSAPVYLYRRTTSATPPAGPSATLVYTFATGTLSGTLAPWSADIPSSGGPYLHRVQALVYGLGPTEEIVPGEWGTARLMAADGAQGPAGPTGPTGATGATGPAGASGTQSAVAYLYQWYAAGATPPDPGGTSTWTWSSGTHSAYGGGGGWSVNVPANPGTPGVQLWVASKAVTAAAGTSSSVVSWTSGFAKYALSGNGLTGDAGAPGSPGAPGVQTAAPTLWRWALSIPTIAGSNTYTWATGAISGTLPSGWTTTPGSGSPGQTLWGATVQIVGSAADTTATIAWSGASITARGYAGADGSPGSPGQAGISARRAYALTTAASLGSGTVTSVGINSLPAPGSFGAASWSASPSTPAAGQVLYQSDGLFNPATTEITWETPYISALKVGQLSALAVNTGDLTANGNITVSGEVFSTGFVAGSTGWRIRGNGTAEFNNVVARGGLYATYGEIAGAVITSTYVQSSNYVPNSAGWRLSNVDGTLYANSALLRNADASRVFNLNATGTQTVLAAPGISILANGSATFAGTLRVGSAPALSGTTMTGTGVEATPSGTLAVGNSSSNLTFSPASGMRLNNATFQGGQIDSPVITSPVLPTLTASISATSSTGVGGNGTSRTGTATITSVSGGRAPYSYAWSLSNLERYGTQSGFDISGASSATISISATGTNAIIRADLVCIVTDANGQSVSKATGLTVQWGTPVEP